jgi:hypothetical protein
MSFCRNFVARGVPFFGEMFKAIFAAMQQKPTIRRNGRSVNLYLTAARDAGVTRKSTGGPFRLAARHNHGVALHRLEPGLGPVVAGDMSCIGQMIATLPEKWKANRMTSVTKALCASLGLIALTASAATAQTARNCAPRDTVVERLASKYGENRQSMGLGANNAVVEVFASSATGSWTITVTSPTGLTCLVASGQHFEELAEALPAKEDDPA